MLPGLTIEQFQKLLLSVGKTPIARRPLSPVEVGHLCERSLAARATRKEITHALGMTDTSMVSKFLGVAKLATAVQHLVAWGASAKGVIGFSAAAQLSRTAKEDHEAIASGILIHDLTKIELTSVVQLLDRSGDDAPTCVKRVVGRRSVLKVRHVFLGGVVGGGLQEQLSQLTQAERDTAMRMAMMGMYPNLTEVSVKLGRDRFSIVGGRQVVRSITETEDFERKVSEELSVAVGLVEQEKGNPNV